MMKRIYPPLFFAGATALTFWKVLFHREFTLLAGQDTAAAYYPWFDVAAYWLKRGVFMLWDPYVYSGKLFMGEPQPGLFYPLNWLFMLLPAGNGGISVEGMQFLLVLDYYLAALFFYYLARSFAIRPIGAGLAGLAWAYGGYMAQIYGYANVLSGFVWFAPSLLAFRRIMTANSGKERIRQILLCGLFLSLSFLPGHHVPAIHTGLFLFFYALFHALREWNRSRWPERVAPFISLASVAGCAILITAIQWIPSAEWARQVYRWIGEGPPVKWGQAVPYSSLQSASNLSPQDATSLLLPYLSTNANLYVGLGVLFFALLGLLLARRDGVGFFGLAALGYFLMSWGRFSALHGWVNTFIPGAWFAREVFYYLIPFQACLAMLAGFGLDHLVEAYLVLRDESTTTIVRRAAWFLASIALFCGVLIPTLSLVREMPMDHPYIKGLAGLATYACILGLMLYFFYVGRLGARLLGMGVVAMVAMDLSTHLSMDIRPKMVGENRENSFVREVWKRTPIVDFLRSRQSNEYCRVDDPGSALPPNFGDAWRLFSTMGHGATALVDYFQFRGTGWGPSSNASALLNARYIVSRFPLPGMIPVFQGDLAVFENPRAVPRVFAVSSYRQFPGKEELLAWVPTPMFSPMETALLRTEDVNRIPVDFLKQLNEESGGIEVRVTSYRTSAEKEAEKTEDARARHRLHLYHAPWGWSNGDEIALTARPQIRLEHCYAVVSYYPLSPESCNITLSESCTGRTIEIPVTLEGFSAGAGAESKPRQAVVDIGPMEPAEYRISFQRPQSCYANIDSIRISTLRPRADGRDAGTVRIVSYKPNQIKMQADLNRAALVIASEIFYPGWEAEVDGYEAPLLEADYILRAIPIPAGRHDIVMRFRPRVFRWGLFTSLLSIVAVISGLVLTRVPRR